MSEKLSISQEEINGMDTSILQDLTASSEPLAALHFDREEYTPFEQLLEHIRQLPDRPDRVPVKRLNVNGRVVSDSMERYLSHAGESSSLLKEALKSPRHYLIARTSELKSKNTHHFDFGTFVHSAILEPSKFSKVRVLPQASKTTASGCRRLIRYYWELLGIQGNADLSDQKIGALRVQIDTLHTAAKEAGYTFIKEDDAKIVDVIRIAYKTYGGGILPKLMQYVKAETSMYGTDPDTGMKVKIRPDGMLLEENFGINAILSIKTTSASSVQAFYNECAKYRYELSEGMYLKVASEITGRPFTATLTWMIQNTAPFQIAVIFWDAEDLQIGKYKYAQALDIVKRCKASGSWPGFDALAEEGAFGIIQGKLPCYIKSELLPQYLPDVEVD